jgi:hypothetical protein
MSLRKAVICGIDEYPAPNRLPSCVNDARAIATIVADSYGCDAVHLVLDRDATIARIEQELGWMVADLRPEDRVFFYYSGHGFTDLRGEVMREFLVLLDETGKPALWEDDRLVAMTAPLESGQCTCLFDCCFSGGMFKWLFDPEAKNAEAVLTKVYKPPADEQQKAFEVLTVAGSGRPRAVTGYRGFGRSSRIGIASTSLGHGSATGWSDTAAPEKALGDVTGDASEVGQAELNGLLISACLETETAAASTSRTGGLSAFTHALLRVLADGRKDRTAQEVFDDAAAVLRDMKFVQTPTCLARAGVPLANRPFLTMETSVMNTTETTPTSPTAPAEQETQKQLLQALVTLVETLSVRHKAFDTDAEDDVDEVDAEPDFSDAFDSDEDARQKALPALAAVALPVLMDLAKRGVSEVADRVSKPKPRPSAPRVVSVRPRPRRKAFGNGGGNPLDRSLVGAIQLIMPHVLRGLSR